MSEKVKKVNKFLNFLNNHFSKIWKAIVGVFIGFVGLVLYKKVDAAITKNDNKKKEELKNNISSTKEAINATKEAVENMHEHVSEIKDQIEKHEEIINNTATDYINAQKTVAEEAGFKKK